MRSFTHPAYPPEMPQGVSARFPNRVDSMHSQERDPLNAFLEAQRAGGRLESSGEFTLALEKAREKLKKFQLADATFYLLKVFQAAVCAGTDHVDIRLTRNQVQLSFWLPDGPDVLEPEELLTAMAAEPPSNDSPLRHLAIGLNAGLAADPVSVVWARWVTPHRGRALDIRDQDLTLLDDPPIPSSLKHPGQGRLFLFRLTKPASLSLSGSCAQEHTSVVLRCGFAPVGVRLDGRPLRSTWRGAPTSDLHQYSAPYYLVERYVLNHPAGIHFRRPGLEAYRRTASTYVSKRTTPTLGGGAPTFCYDFVDPHGQPAVLPPPGQDLVCSAAASLPLALRGPAVVAFVKHGVLIDPKIVCNNGGGAFCVLPANGLSVDLSEFQVIEDEAYRAAVREAVRQWQAMRTRALELADQIPVIKAKVQLEHADKAALVGCCALGPIGLLVGPLVSILARRTRPSSPAEQKLVRDIVGDRLEKLYWNV